MTSERAGDATNIARVGEAANVVQVGQVHGDLHVGGETRRAAPVEIDSLMRAQVLMAEQLPYQLRGARTPSLSTVYVRQDLGTGGDELTSGDARPRPMVDGHGQLVEVSTTPRVRTSVRPPSRTVREALESDDHLVITGGPGQGKSTLTLRLAADLARGWSGGGAEQTTERVVPLRLTARELAARLDAPFAEALAASVRAEYNLRLRYAIDPSHFEDRVSGCRWLLLVDGLDEVTSPSDRDDLVHALAGWAASGDVYRIVLTTRPIEGGVLAPLQRIGAVRYELQPFDEEALRTFAESWFSDDGDAAANFLRQIRKAYLDELVRVPLLATIAAIIFEQRRAHPLPDNQYELYEAYLRYLRTGHQRHPSPLDAHREPLFEHLGLVRVDADTSLLDAARAWATRHVPGDWQDDLVRFLTAVGPFTLRADDVQFLHHSFADHLAATAKARSLPATFSAEHNDFAHLLHAARPREHGRHARRVLLHYGRLHPPQADELLRTLDAGDSEQHLLAARLLAGHLPASPGVTEAFLTTARAWAMTTHYNAYDILAGASRATHHPGLPDWLADLMNDPRAPWTSRAEAAAALATRLRGRHEQAALALLHTVVSDLEGHAGNRLVAAEALSDCGEDQRAAAEQALRGILADPLTTAREHRDAALVLASLGGSARVHATAVLVATLNDPECPPERLIEAADALTQITAEHADLCGDVLVNMLRITWTIYGREPLRIAAETLASLGPGHAAAGIHALIDRVTDLRLYRSERAAAAWALTRIRPSHRALAMRHLETMSQEADVRPYQLWQIGEMMAKCGGECREQAADLLRRTSDSAATPLNALLWTARNLCRIGPDHEPEAVGHLTRLSKATGQHASVVWERERALGVLAALGGARRVDAAAELWATVVDSSVDLRRRDLAAYELIELGPEFHAELIPHLRDMAVQRFHLEVGISAWQSLARLDTGFRAEAAKAQMRPIVTSEEDDRWPPGGLWFNRMVLDDREAASGALLRLLENDDRDEQWRGCAARLLVMFGHTFHRAVVRVLIGLIRSESLPRVYLDEWLREFADLAEVFRREIAEALRDVALSEDSSTAVVVNTVEGIQALGHLDGPELAAVLRPIVFDRIADIGDRFRAAVLLAHLQPEHADAAADTLLQDFRESRNWWRIDLCSLVALGADPVPKLRALATDVNAPVRHRLRVVSALDTLNRNEVPESLLQGFAHDMWLEHGIRSDALEVLALHDDREISGVVRLHERIRDDRTQATAERCESAYRAHELDLTTTSAALTLWRDVATNPERTSAEKVSAVRFLKRMTYSITAATDFLARSIIQDPACGDAEVKLALECQERKSRLSRQRQVLADRSIAVEHRLPTLDRRFYLPLRPETEAMVRDVLAAPESTHRDRVAAAAGLAVLSSRFVGEAADLLSGLGWKGQEELAKLGPRWSAQVRAAARAVADDETQPWRERWKASRFDWTVEGRSAEQRMERAEARSEIGTLRKLLADPRPAVRWRAAKRLREYDFADRVAAAAVLEAIGGSPATRAALRWRAGVELTRFGEMGRERGVAVLHLVMGDEELPVTARAEAATVVGKIRPDLRAEVVRFLRSLRTHDELRRIRLHQLLGVFEPEDGARALQAMTGAGPPLVRIRAAEAMLGLRRDYRERAAVTARDVMQDDGAPWHVRRRAARDLARWSDLALEEARAWLRACRRP
ncbi:NACHT domain-containing NTPase [Lentzea sp. HUAS12]|uniref:NACHT domain-containing protein n=1 Tax=Lentzea sp. HUAS12 TaxID=2951806 RepID=UPI0020A04701|nr:NACHT domain-containing protein [Lentzea sp. HUAS12]USX55913.1 NACHT domain-containing protein [Lentzea sp. HUAS12]